MSIDWNDPEQRLRHLERVGLAQYNLDLAAEHNRQIVETCNGHNIRMISTARLGIMFMVEGTDLGSATLEGARVIARNA